MWFKIAQALRGRLTTVGRTKMKVSIAERKEKGEAQNKAQKEAAKHVQLYKPSAGAEKAKADLMQLTMQIPFTPVPVAVAETQEKKVEESKATEDVPQQVAATIDQETKVEEVKTV